MEIPKIPQALVGSIVRSNRDPDRLGRIQRIEVDSDRPFVLWEGNEIPIATEWQHIEAVVIVGADVTFNSPIDMLNDLIDKMADRCRSSDGRGLFSEETYLALMSHPEIVQIDTIVED